MSYRREELSDGEIYHIYNRGVDKRVIFKDNQDFFQFMQMLDLCNIDMTCGGLNKYKYPSNLERRKNKKPLVEIISYCLNQNHYHLMLRQIGDDGISKFMHKIGTAYAKYFNKKYDRTGPLLSGRFKSVHVGTDEYLKGLSAYINLNNIIHGLVRGKKQCRALLFRSSWWEYGGDEIREKEKYAFHPLCEKGVVLDSFKSKKEYTKWAKEYVRHIINMRRNKMEIDSDKNIFLE